MEFFLPIVVLYGFSRNAFGKGIREEGTPYGHEVSYQELMNMNASCYPFDSCWEYRTDDPINPSISSFDYKCSCNRQCWEIGTCCIDSPYRFKPPTHECRKTGYYMVYKCPDNTYTDSIWKNKCEKDWNEEDDILMLSPVTSLDTSVTYKNYYCFRCHERTDKYVSWNLLLESSYEVSGKRVNFDNLAYNYEQKTWAANLYVDGYRISTPAILNFLFPYNKAPEPISCNPNLIADCSESWTDKRVQDKCLAYTALVYQLSSSYKNVHCALCNYVPLDRLTCSRIQTGWNYVGGSGGSGGSGYVGRIPKNFIKLFDINDSEAGDDKAGDDKAGDDKKCDNKHLWDPYSMRCRKIYCAHSDFVIKNELCVPP